MHRPADATFKIIVIGHSGAGKTALQQSFVKGDGFAMSMCQSTMGVEVEHKRVHRDGCSYCLEMWDTAGEEQYMAYLPRYVRECDVVMAIFSLGDGDSASRTLRHVEYVREVLAMATDEDRPEFALVGTKLDVLVPPGEDMKPATAVARWSAARGTDGELGTPEQALKVLRRACGMPFEILTSAKRGFNVNEAFEGVLDTLLDRRARRLVRDQNSLVHEIRAPTGNGQACDSGGATWSDDASFDTVPLDNALETLRVRNPVARSSAGKEGQSCCS